MMMNPQKIAMIVSKLSEDHSADTEMDNGGASSDSSAGKQSAMKSFLAAVKADDASGAASALEDFVALCGEHGAGDEDGDDAYVGS